MENITPRIKILFDRWFSETITEEEWVELRLLTETRSAWKYDLPDLLQEQWNVLKPGKETLSAIKRSELGKSITGQYPAEKTMVISSRLHLLRTAWFRVAASLVLVAGTCAYLWLKQSTSGYEITSNKPVPVKKDILPGGEKAVLTLSNGQQVNLNHATAVIIKDGNLSIDNKNGELSYKNANTVAMNTMTTPRGGQYRLTLADGTKVWLNAASSIDYPTAFKEKERIVQVRGEVYFDIAKDKSKPFLVKTNRELIEVLGTKFNVNAYSDEPFSKTTLVEGSIKINKQILKPGEAYSRGIIKAANIQGDVAWKEGMFNFNGRDLPNIMRQLERWYDITVQYEVAVPKVELKGEMDSGVHLSDFIQYIKDLGINARLEGKTLIILSK